MALPTGNKGQQSRFFLPPLMGLPFHGKLLAEF